MINIRRAIWVFVGAVGLALASRAGAEDVRAENLISNGQFELDENQDGWPDAWPKMKADGFWLEEEGNRFLRLESSAPDKMVMLYREIAIPPGVEALELSWRQRVTGLKPGKQAWFDARIMLEFMDAGRNKAAPTPKPSFTRRNTDGWVEKNIAFLVPSNAATLKFMPSLFQVEAGMYDLDDFVLTPTEPGPLRVAQEAAKAAQDAKVAKNAAGRRAKAAERLREIGSLIPNGGFEASTKREGLPDGWGNLPAPGAWEVEEGNRFMRLVSDTPDKLVSAYYTFDLPEGVEALTLEWRNRVTGLKAGDKPWFDARIMMEFLDESGKKMPKQPRHPYAQKNTSGWVDRSTSFLVPTGALTLVVMPSLFRVKAGTFDLDDLKLVPSDPEPLHLAAAASAAAAAARYVPPEDPVKDRWPKMLRVEGNRVLDSDGEAFMLKGVNAGGLETLPMDDQPVKSVVVAIEEWKANCIRVPVKDEFWFGKSPWQEDGGKSYREKIDHIVTLAANRGAYIVIDLHRYRAPKEIHAEFWRDCAARYANHPAVLFDLFNEPHGISWEVWRNGGFVRTAEGVDESAFLTEEEKRQNEGYESIGMQALVEAVRSTGAKNIVIAGGLAWCNDLTGVVNGYALEDPTGNGIMYSWHTYNWHDGWDKLLPVAAQHPIFVGEFGADTNKMGFIPLDKQEDPYTWVPDMLGFIEQYRLHWTGWCFHPRATPVMISDWQYTPTPFWGAFAKEALAGRSFVMKRMR